MSGESILVWEWSPKEPYHDVGTYRGRIASDPRMTLFILEEAGGFVVKMLGAFIPDSEEAVPLGVSVARAKHQCELIFRHWLQLHAYRLLAPMPAFSPGLRAIFDERFRQITEEQFTDVHDDKINTSNQLAWAAMCYVEPHIRDGSPKPGYWPWPVAYWKPSDDPVRNLVKAGALIAAEIDRLERAEGPALSADGGEL
jgi:hypothetical protein